MPFEMPPLKVLIVPDKFKGTLTARQAAEAIAEGWRKARPDDALELLPMSDGGDGFGVILGELLGAETRTVETVDAAHRPCTAKWWWIGKDKLAVVESANVIGLAMLPPARFHPFDLDTFGLGAVLQDIAASGADRCVIGIGGSATNDGGTGMARALGWSFRGDGEEITKWFDLRSLVSIRPPTFAGRAIPRLEVAVDVQNALVGPRGCSAIYGPQKGLSPDEIRPADLAMKKLGAVVSADLGIEANTPGDGAAGGLGFGLRCFAGGVLRPGFELFARQIGLEVRLSNVDLVITGEGSIDRSTLMGKGVGELACLCGRLETPCIGLGGSVEGNTKDLDALFNLTAGITNQITSFEEAQKQPSDCLSKLAERTAQRWPPADKRLAPATGAA